MGAAGGTRTIKVRMVGDAKSITSASNEAGRSIDKLGKGINRVSVGIVGAAVAIGAALLHMGDEIDAANDTIQQKTGATGKALQGLQADFEAVARVVPASLEDVASATAEVHQRTGLTGKALQDLTEQEIRLNKMTGGDLSSTIANTTRLFGDWGIKTKDQRRALDEVFRASQATGAGIDTITQSVVEFGAPLRQLGFSFDESIVMLGKWEKEGVNTELVLGGMKKALGTFAKAHKDPQKELRKLIADLKGAKSTMEANAIAVKVLGVKAGPDFAAAVREGRFEYGDLLAQVEGGKNTIVGTAKATDDWREKLQLLKNNAMIDFKHISADVFDSLSKVGIPALAGILRFTKDNIGPMKILGGTLAGIAVAVLAINAAAKGYAALVAAVTVVTDLWTAAQIALDVALLANPIGVVIAAIGLIVLGVGLIIKGLEGLGVTWDDVWGGIKTGWNATVGFLKFVGKALVDDFKLLAWSILFPFKLAFNGVAIAWNNTIGKIDFTIPGWVPIIGGNHFSVPDIPLTSLSMPKLAGGGMAFGNRPVIVGEKGPEIFTPGRTGRVSSNADSQGMMGGDIYVAVQVGDQPVREMVRAERVQADRATRSWVSAAKAA